MVNDETLDVLRVVNELPQAVVDLVQDLLSDSVVAARKVVGGVLLPVQQELGVEHLRERASANVVDDRRLKVNRDLARHELAGAGLLEEGGEVLVSIRLALPVLFDVVFSRVLGPDCVPELDSGLADGDRQNFT